MEFFDGTPLATLEYTIKSEQYGKAFIAFQKKYVFPKNYILTGIFVIIIFLYANQIYHDPSYSIAWLLIGMCIIFIGQMWFNTFRTRSKLMTSIKEIADNRYSTLVFEEGLQISTLLPEYVEPEPALELATDTGITQHRDPYDDDENIITEIPPRQIVFARDNPHIISGEDMFVIYLKKQMFYVLPKNELSDADVNMLTELFARKMK